MNLFTAYCILFILAFVINFLLTKGLITLLIKYQIVDMPGSRRAHTKTTPRGGGVAIALVFVMGFVLFEYFYLGYLQNSQKILPLFLLISLISFLDDLHAVSVPVRLSVHLVSAMLANWLFLYPGTLFHNEIPLLADFILTTLGLTAFLNIYNFLDGIDGITASETIHLTITTLALCLLRKDIILHADLIITISVILLACSLSFLFFNWSPAKIFIGDIGTIGIGFLIGLCLMLMSASSDRLFASSCIASLYYLADGGLTILIRLVRGEKVWQPHLKHFFQQAVRKGMSHKQVVGRIILCNFCLMILAINALFSPAISIILAILVVIITIINLAK